MMNKEMLEGLFKNQLKDKLEYLEKRDTNESTCLKLLTTNMETIKISLAKPMQALSPLNIKWDECTESGDVLTIVLRNMGTKSLSVGDTILFRRTCTVEKDTRYGDGIDVIVEQEVKVISIENDNTFKVEVPIKKAVLRR